MNAQLKHVLEDAERRLGASDQARLAELVETFVATHEGEGDFTPEELARLARIEAEPSDPADPAEVAALFARRG